MSLQSGLTMRPSWSAGERRTLNKGRMIWMLVFGLFCLAMRLLNAVEPTAWVGQGADGAIIWILDGVQHRLSLDQEVPYLALGLPIPLNSADAPTLTTISGIGPVKSESIVNYRSMHGCFGRVLDLKKVPGIGPKTVLKVAPYLRIDGFAGGACASPPNG